MEACREASKDSVSRLIDGCSLGYGPLLAYITSYLVGEPRPSTVGTETQHNRLPGLDAELLSVSSLLLPLLVPQLNTTHFSVLETR